jgi:hypothetical protein
LGDAQRTHAKTTAAHCRAGDLAYFFEAREDVSQMFAYLQAIQASGCKDAPGFECSVHETQALQWLKVNRPSAWARVLCESRGVSLLQIEDDPDVEGLWFWIDDASSEKGFRGFSSEGAAALDAAEALRFE